MNVSQSSATAARAADIHELVGNQEFQKLPRPLLRKIGRRALNGFASAKDATVGLLAPPDDPLHGINQFHGIKLLGLEGYMRSDQAEWFQKLLIQKPGIRNIAEVGFNGGHSSYAFLGARPDTEVRSFDIGLHEYVGSSKRFIDETFGRHQLILGDSRRTIPHFASENPDYKADLIFIDGGHGYNEAKADMENARALAHKDTLVVMDDYMSHVPWGQGPVKVWDSMVAGGQIHQQEIATGQGRSWAVGRYIGL